MQKVYNSSQSEHYDNSEGQSVNSVWEKMGDDCEIYRTHKYSMGTCERQFLHVTASGTHQTTEF